MWFKTGIACAALIASANVANSAEVATNSPSGSSTNLPAWVRQPLSLADALNVALQHNSDILRGKADLEAAHGVVVQTRAIALPKLQFAGTYKYDQAVESFPFTVPTNIPAASFPSFPTPEHQWSGNVRVLQSIYEGGRI